MDLDAFMVERRGEDEVLRWEMGVEWAEKKLAKIVEGDEYLASDNEEVAPARQEGLVQLAELQLAIAHLELEKAQEVRTLLVEPSNMCCELFFAT